MIYEIKKVILYAHQRLSVCLSENWLENKSIMSKIFSFLCLFLLQNMAFSQSKDIYNPNADAKADIAAAVKLAKQSNKHVLIQVGGNWCIWCHRLHDFIQADKSLDSLMNVNYVVVHVNYDSEHHNDAVMKDLGYPQRFGFPVLVILDEKGKRLHTQDSALLEKEKVYYNAEHLSNFFRNWSKTGMIPTPFRK